MASKSSRVVKYQKVKETLAGDIERGKYSLGERLPSEKQLADQFEVSIITIRQAVEALAARRLPAPARQLLRLLQIRRVAKLRQKAPGQFPPPRARRGQDRVEFSRA